MSFKQLFDACSEEPDREYAMVTAMDRAQKEGSEPGHSRSKGCMTTKILALTDALGNLVRFDLLPGHRYDTIGVPPLIDGLTLGGLIADMAFDSNAIVAELDQRGTKLVIAQNPRRISPPQIDADLCLAASGKSAPRCTASRQSGCLAPQPGRRGVGERPQ